MSSQELALYIHAMLVACMDPRDFYGLNLVQELRKRTEVNANYTNPFQILVLCNAGDKMTTRDVDRVMAAYDSQHSGIGQSSPRLLVYKIQPRHGRKHSKRHATETQEAPVREWNCWQFENHSTCRASSADTRFFRQRFQSEIGSPIHSPEREWQNHAVKCLLRPSSPDRQ
ncbi:hypothetical protein TNIN_128061 [Trichonephila inaurata madagascariensis]|uniref:Uncharacterized protein n=1 Tax=Trichonephila inaurata madagascariensis TaxID=2747483 RepID=A0A8X6YJX1_9ARAC|nr:hypothetical protein TNIN_128061 [Trichonephila inaurata madagascariensis]